MSNESERLLAYRRTVTIFAVIIVLVLSFLIIRPFLIAIISAAVLAYLFYPIYKYLKLRLLLPRFIPKNTVAALITVTLAVLIVLLPMIFVTGILTNEIRMGYLFFHKKVTAPDFRFDLPPLLVQYVGDISQYKDMIASFGAQAVGWLQGVVQVIPNVVINIFIAVFSLYFFLKGGDNIYSFLQDFFPLSERRYKQIFARFNDLSRGMVLGQIVVGVIHGILAWAAYAILCVPNPVLWAFLTAIISIIPVFGAGLVWAPIAIYLIIVGYTTGAYWKGIALLVYGFSVMTTIDNVLKPKIIGDRSRIHPLVILFGILGGIQLIGLPGIIIGPMVLALFDLVMEIFRDVV